MNIVKCVYQRNSFTRRPNIEITHHNKTPEKDSKPKEQQEFSLFNNIPDTPSNNSLENEIQFKGNVLK